MFDKILIANRGEIACRVIKTARKLGLKTVAVYSEADADALHVEMADEAVLIGPPPSNQSYLLGEKIIQACKDTGAQAVHPGYGFLSENAAFAEDLAKNDIVLIGPGPDAMVDMGDKIRSKKIAMEAGVSGVPGHAETVSDPDEAVKIARELGYPVMLKASAGGGGKGMRVAWNDVECRDGLTRAMSEGKASFGDDRVFVEKFIEDPRHIEIQVLADSHGTCLYLGERECSIQRRHQKVIEEAPSPFVTAKLRKAMGEQAVALAKAVGYVSAGTVEFIVDKDRNFYFLEMNTRLQVEHPVTEMITGLDLVEWMIRIAAGEKLTLRQQDVTLNGWSLEARVYAEDPFRNFMPSIGRLVRYLAPDENPSLRIDSGIHEGGEISMFYDPMIAKVVTHGKDRNAAIEKMADSLDQFFIRGVSHNISFLAALVSHRRFCEGRLTTNFIAEEYPDGFNAADVPHADSTVFVAVAACVHRAYQDRASQISGQMKGHERVVRNEWAVFIGESRHEILIVPAEDGYRLEIGDAVVQVVSDWKLADPLFRGRINGKSVCLSVERDAYGYRLRHRGAQADAVVLAPRVAAYRDLMPVKIPPDMSRFLLSPMPGLLVSLAVGEGEEVKAGQALAVVEAMKMENVLKAERDGRVKTAQAAVGDSLRVDQVILEFE